MSHTVVIIGFKICSWEVSSENPKTSVKVATKAFKFYKQI